MILLRDNRLTKSLVDIASTVLPRMFNSSPLPSAVKSKSDIILVESTLLTRETLVLIIPISTLINYKYYNN